MKFKPYKILWWTIPIICIPILLGKDSSFDIQYHDTYFVIYSWLLAILFTTMLLILGGIYWVLKSYEMIGFLSFIHSIGTSISIIGIAVLTILQTLNRPDNLDLFLLLNSIGIIVLLIFLCIQIVLIINVIMGLAKSRN